jgi:Na+-driven multidrug efflux pump
LINEFSWSVGENIYAAIYGRLGTAQVAAMTLVNPMMGMFIGMFSGVSAAATVMIGKRLGRDEQDEAYSIAKYMAKVGAIGSVIVSVILVVISDFYVNLFDVEPEVMQTSKRIIYVLAIYLIVKISNMIVAGGVIRSGGKTKYTLYIDLVGTWVFGVPLGLLGAFVFKWPIEAVYALLSFEEVVRLIITFVIFKNKKWMQNVTREA